MKILKKTVPFWALLLVVILSASAVVAAIVASRQVNMTMRTLARNDIELYQPDHTTILTSIDLGDFYRGDEKSFPSDAPTSYYFIDNIGEGDVWVKWRTTENGKEASEFETQLIQDYVMTFQDKPPLNISIKRQMER